MRREIGKGRKRSGREKRVEEREERWVRRVIKKQEGRMGGEDTEIRGR